MPELGRAAIRSEETLACLEAIAINKISAATKLQLIRAAHEGRPGLTWTGSTVCFLLISICPAQSRHVLSLKVLGLEAELAWVRRSSAPKPGNLTRYRRGLQVRRISVSGFAALRLWGLTLLLYLALENCVSLGSFGVNWLLWEPLMSGMGPSAIWHGHLCLLSNSSSGQLCAVGL